MRATASGWYGEQPRHLGGGLQVALGIGLQPVARLADPAARADARHHVLERAPLGMVVERVRDSDHRRAGGRAQLGEQTEAAPLVARRVWLAPRKVRPGAAAASASRRAGSPPAGAGPAAWR